MIRMRGCRALPVAAVLLLSVGATTAGQSPSPGPAITVVATDYHFADLPTTVPVGTRLTIDNQGAEYHELLVVRLNDGVTRSWDELLEMPQEEAFRDITVVGGPEPLIAAPGTTASGSILIARPGDYLVACFIPQGSVPGAPQAPAREHLACWPSAFHAGHGADVHGDRLGDTCRTITVRGTDGIGSSVSATIVGEEVPWPFDSSTSMSNPSTSTRSSS